MCVDDIPDSRISARVDRLVDTYLAARAAGQESSIGSHLNYAIPHFSDARYLGWINPLGSLHYSDRALDVRGNNISVADGNRRRAAVSERLGAKDDGLFETFLNTSNNYLHVEFDPH